MNGDEATMLVIEIAVVLDPLVTVTVCAGLVAPTRTFPKLSALGESPRVGILGFVMAGETSSDCANAGRANAAEAMIVRTAIGIVVRMIE